MQVYKYTPLLEKPTFGIDSVKRRDSYNPQETAFAGDMLTQDVFMVNPYAKDDSTSTKERIPNSWNKMFIPQFQKMYLSFKNNAK